MDSQKYVSTSVDVIHYTGELAYGNRDYEVTEEGNPRHIRFRTDQELWHKESLGNAVISRLPEDAKYIAFIDGDIKFSHDKWAEYTIQQLQHYDVVQMWSYAHELGPCQEPLQTHTSFIYCWVHGVQPYWKAPLLPKDHDDPHHPHHHIHHRHHHPHYFIDEPAKRPTGPHGEIYWHPGFAWAYRKSALNHLGGLIDWAILGAGDHHMAMALIGEVLTASIPKQLHHNYMDMCKEWQERALKYINFNVGYVPMTLLHYWHGKKANRNYWGRWDVLTQNGFDPMLDIKKDTQGLWQLTGRHWKLRDGIRAYFRSRDEDSTDL